MTIALSTRSRCDECDRPAVLVDRGAFLCELCDVRINGAVENSNSDASASRPDVAPVAEYSPRFHAAGATVSYNCPKCGERCTCWRTNAGERPGTEAPALFDRLEILDLESVLSGTPGACSSEREDVGALNSNSGDGLGNHEPGSITWGGGNATAPSGRADESAICPAVAGMPSCGSFGSLPDTLSSVMQLRAASLDMPGPQDLIPEAGACGFDFDAAITALEAGWRRGG